MTDTERLDFLQSNKIQCWPNSKGLSWTVWFKPQDGRFPIQPTAATLRNAIDEAFILATKEIDL